MTAACTVTHRSARSPDAPVDRLRRWGAVIGTSSMDAVRVGTGVSDTVAIHTGLPSGVSRDLGDDRGLHLGEPDSVPAAAESAGDNGVWPGMPRPCQDQNGGQGRMPEPGTAAHCDRRSPAARCGVAADDDAFRSGDGPITAPISASSVVRCLNFCQPRTPPRYVVAAPFATNPRYRRPRMSRARFWRCPGHR